MSYDALRGRGAPPVQVAAEKDAITRPRAYQCATGRALRRVKHTRCSGCDAPAMDVVVGAASVKFVIEVEGGRTAASVASPNVALLVRTGLGARTVTGLALNNNWNLHC